jgi:hypothetical protein
MPFCYAWYARGKEGGAALEGPEKEAMKSVKGQRKTYLHFNER